MTLKCDPQERGFAAYADGKMLYGDDFSPAEIETWFRDEEEAYYNLGGEKKQGNYGYHALNWLHGFRHLPKQNFEHVLGIGSAFGDELQPILDDAKKVTILEPSEGFSHSRFEYVKPNSSGKMAFLDDSFDLITCFGVLHHIPNVSYVMQELARCMKPGGWLLMREPIHSMGNWDQPRRGLTRRERGIPLPLLHKIVGNAGLRTVHEARCMFSLTARTKFLLPKSHAVYNSKWITALDRHVCRLPMWPESYHPGNFFQRFRPWAVFAVLQKPE